MSLRSLPARVASLLTGGLVLLFIALPIGAMLVRSFAVEEPVPLIDLKNMTEAALAHLPDGEAAMLVYGWVEATKPQQRMAAVAAALELNGLAVTWDRMAANSDQIVAAEAALIALSSDLRRKVEADVPIALVMLHRRIPLAFKVRDKLTEDEFDILRSGKYQTWGLDHYLSVVGEERLRRAGVNSLRLALPVTFGTTLLAFLLAFGINRGAVRGASFARYGILIPLVSPPVVIATATILLFGRNGLITKGLLDTQLGLIDAGLTNIYGLPGVILAQLLGNLPPAFIILDNVLSMQDGRLEEAAAIQGSSPWQTFRQVTLPMAQPGLIRAATLVFIMSMTDFGNPMVVGKDMPVLAGVLYDEMIGFHNTSLSSAIAVWLIVPALCIFAMLNRLGHRKRFESSEVNPSEIALPGWARGGLTTLAWSIISLTGIIYITIIIGSFVRLWGVDYTFTPHHYTSVEAMPGFVTSIKGVEPVWISLRIAAIAAPLGGLLALVIAFLAERVRGWFNESITFIVMLPAILPGVVFGIGYIVAFNNPLGIKALSLNGTFAILVLNIVFGNIFVGVLSGRALLRRLDSSVDEAAEILGASLLQRFIHVTLPMMRRAAVFGTLYVFVDGLCTFSSVVFLQGPDMDLASVVIFKEASVSYYGTACAISVSILLIVFVAMTGISLLNRYGKLSLFNSDQGKRPVPV